MDFENLAAARERRGRVVVRAISVTAAFCVAAWLAFSVEGAWSMAHYSAAMLAIAGLCTLEWQLSVRRSVNRALDREARALGLAPARSDSRLYEGVIGRGTVRVWVGDVDRGAGGFWPPTVAVGLGTGASIWMDEFGPVVFASIAVAVMVWSAWRTRPIIEIEGVFADGQRHRSHVRRSTDLEYAIAVLPGEQPTAERFSLLPGIDVQHLLARVERTRSEEGVLGALSAIAEVGSAKELGPLTAALRKRVSGMSPRIALAGEHAAARIRERNGLAEPGALALGDPDDRAGRIGIAGEPGALSEPDDE